MRGTLAVALLALGVLARAQGGGGPPSVATTTAPGTAVANAPPRPLKRRLVIKVGGTVLYADTFRLKSPIEGRVEVVTASTGTWAGDEAPVALVASAELAALLDAEATTPRDILEDRWRRLYKPAELRCPGDCYVLHVYARPKKWVKANAVMLEAARTLKLLGRVKPEDGHWVKDGMTVVAWPKADPKRRLRLSVQNFILDVQGTKQGPWGSFTMRLSRDAYFPAGTGWEGSIDVGEVDVPTEPAAIVKTESRTAARAEPTGRLKGLFVPTKALIRFKDALYLPVRVSTGVSTTDSTEITAGLADKQPYLVMNLAELDCSTATVSGRGSPPRPGARAPGQGPAKEEAPAPPRTERAPKDDRIEILDPPPPEIEE